MASQSEISLETRTTPVQQRGMERVEKLLDAAGKILDRAGISGLTTSAVAEASGSSVGVVYRYYPNVEAMLIALAERNLHRFGAILSEKVSANAPATWQGYVRTCLELYAEFSRSTPGFMAVRFGDALALRYAHRDATNNDIIVEALLYDFARHYSIETTDELRYQVKVGIEIADALTARAFLREKDGELRFVESAIEIINRLVADYLAARSR